MEKVYFHKLVLEAWVASRARRLPWIFGSLVALSGLIGTFMNADLAKISSLEELFRAIVQKTPQEVFFFSLLLLGLFVVSVIGKSNLIVALSFIVHKHQLPNHPGTPRAVRNNFLRAFSIESLTLLFLLAVIGILCVPLLIASRTNPGALPTLISFGFLTFLLIALIVFLIKQFTLFYLLFSSLSLRGSIETGSFLFSRFMSLSFFFALFSFILTLLFTFFVNLVILGITVLWEKFGLSAGGMVLPSFALSALFLTWFAIFEQALWLAFFKAIASPQEKSKVAAETEGVLENGVLPEIPPTQ
ncbi:MAG: hypothetical protein WAV46_01615 [Candidatus Moraniibacteriota bacterium]